MAKINAQIEVRQRSETGRKYWAHTRIYFFHEGENVLENLFNRRGRPQDLYRTYLGDVAEAMGLPRYAGKKRFAWSQKAGCSCGCSPGFVCTVDSTRDVFVTLRAAPVVKQGVEAAQFPKQPPANVVWC